MNSQTTCFDSCYHDHTKTGIFGFDHKCIKRILYTIMINELLKLVISCQLKYLKKKKKFVIEKTYWTQWIVNKEENILETKWN